MHPRHSAYRPVLTLAVAMIATSVLAQPVPIGPAFGQPFGTSMSNAERLLLFRLGTGRTNYRSFQRYMFAADALQRAETPPIQELARERNARGLAGRNRQSLSSTMRSGEGDPFARAGSAAAALANSDIVLIWHTFGLSFGVADPKVVQATAPQYSGGLVVAAVAVNGPADKAGWRSGDILIGLYKFRTVVYSDVAYIASLPNFRELGPIRAILIREGKVINSEITPTDEASMAADGQSDAAAGPGSREPAGELPQTQSAERRHSEPSSDTSEAGIVWTIVGVRVETVPLTNVTGFPEGAKITTIRSGSPAANAGWNISDILLGLGSYRMTGIDDLFYIATEPKLMGADVPTKILSKGTVTSGTIRLSAAPAASVDN